jgi:hypothetical protein
LNVLAENASSGFRQNKALSHGRTLSVLFAAPMPSGVEHSGSTLLAPVDRQPFAAPMPSGAEHFSVCGRMVVNLSESVESTSIPSALVIGLLFAARRMS